MSSSSSSVDDVLEIHFIDEDDFFMEDRELEEDVVAAACVSAIAERGSPSYTPPLPLSSSSVDDTDIVEIHFVDVDNFFKEGGELEEDVVAASSVAAMEECGSPSSTPPLPQSSDRDRSLMSPPPLPPPQPSPPAVEESLPPPPQPPPQESSLLNWDPIIFPMEPPPPPPEEDDWDCDCPVFLPLPRRRENPSSTPPLPQSSDGEEVEFNIRNYLILPPSPTLEDNPSPNQSLMPPPPLPPPPQPPPQPPQESPLLNWDPIIFPMEPPPPPKEDDWDCDCPVFLPLPRRREELPLVDCDLNIPVPPLPLLHDIQAELE